MTVPTVVSLPGLPDRVTIVEVGPRDGLQNEKKPIPTEVKLEFIDRLAAAGHQVIEATSFVNPAWVPQLADAAELYPRIQQRDGIRFPVLVPNLRGLTGALAAGAREIAIFGSATDSFAAKNLASSYHDQFSMFEPVVAQALSEDVKVRAYLSMCYGDPWEGAVDPHRVVAAGRRLLELGCYELSLGDTIGVGTAGQVAQLIELFGEQGIDPDRLAVHFHDTYGQALANTIEAMRCGVRVIDASAGGLGGCPYAQSATGNLATEDLVWTLDGLGIEHGLNLRALASTSRWMAEQLGRPAPSSVVRALDKAPSEPV